jgi:hypothetical protein
VLKVPKQALGALELRDLAVEPAVHAIPRQKLSKNHKLCDAQHIRVGNQLLGSELRADSG